MRRVSSLCLLTAAFLALGGSLSLAGEDPAAPAAKQPFAGDGPPIDYEDVLDRSDLVLAGKVAKLAGGQVELEDVRALRGEFTEKTARVSFTGSWAESPYPPPVAGQVGVHFCLRGKDGTLRLAGNPPRGGGFMPEGPTLAEKLLDAARDPKKGFESKDAAVRLSSACRLAKAWAAAEEGKKSDLPAGIVEVLLAGMEPATTRAARPVRCGPGKSGRRPSPGSRPGARARRFRRRRRPTSRRPRRPGLSLSSATTASRSARRPRERL